MFKKLFRIFFNIYVTVYLQYVIGYMAFKFISDDSNELKIKAPQHKVKVHAEELITLPNSEEKVFKDGGITVKNLPPYGLKNSDADKPTIKKKSCEH